MATRDTRHSDRRCASAFLGPRPQLLSLALRPGADPVPLRRLFGDAGETICRRIYRRDSAGFRVVKTVHMEAEWDRADPVAETRWIERCMTRIRPCRAPASATPNPDRPDIAEVLAGHAREPAGARHPPQADRRRRPARCEARRAGLDGRSRAGAPAMRCWSASDFHTTCRRRGGISTPRPSLPPIFRARRSSSTTPGLPADRSAGGACRLAHARSKRSPRSRMPRSRFPGSAGAGQPWTVEANGPIIRDAIAIFGSSAACSPAIFRSTVWSGRSSDLRRLLRVGRRLFAGAEAKAVRRQRRANSTG